MTTGERIKKRRKELGVSAETLADRCGLSPATIYRYENGDIGNMGADKIAAIAKALGTTSGTLLGEADFSEQFAVVTGNKKLMALYETMRANADLIPPLSEDPETVSLHVKSVLDEMKKNGHRFSDMLELTLNKPGSSNVSASSNEGEPHVNIVKIAGRDGSFVEKHLTDKQLQALKSFVDLLPDASDDL